MSTEEARFGPLVHRSVHHGAALWLAATLQFVLVMAIVQLAWTGHPGYSLANNVISDLGNTQCGPWPKSTSHDVCSPWHDLFDGSLIVLGALVALGAFLVRTGFPLRRLSSIGLGMLIASALGSLVAGVFPENTVLLLHEIGALIAFVAGNFALLVLGVTMFRDTRWNGLRAYTFFSGLLGLVALGMFLAGDYFFLGVGGMERLIVAPLLLWQIVASARLLRIPQFAPHRIPTGKGH